MRILVNHKPRCLKLFQCYIIFDMKDMESLNGQPLVSNQEGGSITNSPKCWLVSIFLTAFLCMVFSLCAMVFALQAKNKEIPSDMIPRRYAVDRSYILPPTNQMNIGSCWCFSMIYLLESHYHHQGVEQGYLEPNEYVSFSKQAFFTWLGDQCHKHPEVKACYYGGLMSNSSEDQQIESLYYFAKAWNETYNAVLPESVCPYTAKPDPIGNWSYFDCPGLYDALESNPIKWSFKKIANAYNVQGAKELLFKSKRALGIGSPLPNLRYYVPCADSLFADKDQCVQKLHECPNGNGYCFIMDLDGRQQDGVFLSNVDTKFMSELGGHAMNFVGYNDDWFYRNRFQTPASVAPMTGGFILHNSWRPEGHSVEYYMGEQSEENEAVLCPNHKTPFNWIPVDTETVKEHLSNLDTISTGIRRVRGNGTTDYADRLVCKNADYCDVDADYFLQREDSGKIDANVSILADGLNDISFIKVKSGQVESQTIHQFPFWALSQIFTPKNPVENDPNGCGYWMLPYQTIENMIRINWDLFDNFRVFDIDIEFEPRSFLKHKDSQAYNTTLLEQSTKRMDTQPFDGPLPYEYIYH
ncbi:hypothetical protein TRFO_12800 [Tritrichomonas foetus]|uniref:Peptidase C1A papain C-terminal domain-containing protein n=1 Tax=Tritrichomonas foetus TaxID=1144522 RepID=A0A1J4L0D4_9EUKA|nr:hypothetical protein TRFO_12800 [Tritrichomonas foetus]|eukprot:OHT16923.1 hypothetical protein TRFO_12800 [Tritrichomonas foetus]